MAALLLSMTGFGQTYRHLDRLSIAVEVRSVNHRYLKIQLRTSDGYSGLEPLVESVVRRRIRRGTVYVDLRIQQRAASERYRIDLKVLDSYRRQLEAVRTAWNQPEPISFSVLLGLPGVIYEELNEQESLNHDWPMIREALEEALDRLDRMRAEEGRAMGQDLRLQAQQLREAVERIAQRAPLVVDQYRCRLQERIENLLQEYQITLQPGDLVRETALFAERSDIAEELVRLRSHIDQLVQCVEHPEAHPEGVGRKLDFLTQEMFREANTIGSKANDVQIVNDVIYLKGAIERIREMVQNLQ
ncbi:MAG TPA: YicC family protein [Thermoguttaceae bacterium]|nr:YicC family protein [Thermoguttaceae bacterium]HPP53011.1 YicC family protein [Thermoguttaceae bacterium]